MAKKSRLGFLGWRILKLLRMPNRYCLVVHDYTNPYSSTLPKELQVGEKLNLLFPINEDALLAVNPTHVGVVDTFGRYHWATRSSLKRTKKEYLEKFEKKPWDS